MADSGSRKARAISAVAKPPKARKVRATRASTLRAGWQQVKMRRSWSSGKKEISSGGAEAGAAVSAWRKRVLPRRIESISLRCAAVVIQAAGLAGIPRSGHVARAEVKAS
jgi:hypothetical protein